MAKKSIKDLQKEEMKNIVKKDEEIELFNLEDLIIQGKDSKIPITIEFPINGEVKKAEALIRPLTSSEWNNCVRQSMGFKNNINYLITKYGLMTKDGEQFPEKLLKYAPSGVIEEIGNQISIISGFNRNDEDNKELVRDLMGF